MMATSHLMSQVNRVLFRLLNRPVRLYSGSSLTSRMRIKTLAYGIVLESARLFSNDISVPCMALTVGVVTAMDNREIVAVVTKQRKSLALSKVIGALRLCIYFQRRVSAHLV